MGNVSGQLARSPATQGRWYWCATHGRTGVVVDQGVSGTGHISLGIAVESRGSGVLRADGWSKRWHRYVDTTGRKCPAEDQNCVARHAGVVVHLRCANERQRMSPRNRARRNTIKTDFQVVREMHGQELKTLVCVASHIPRRSISCCLSQASYPFPGWVRVIGWPLNLSCICRLCDARVKAQSHFSD